MSFRSKFLTSIVFLTLLSSCVWENIRKPWVPHVAQEAENLEAQYTEASPKTINAKHWDTVDYVLVSFNTEEAEKGNLYEDGYLNMTGMYNGSADFKPEMTVKAAYDNDNMYILAQWTDESINAQFSSLFLDGNEDPLKSDSATGWTSQGNSDNLTISFTENGITTGDAWKWGTAYSAPVGKAIDLTVENGDYKMDEGDYWMKRNGADDLGRTMPLYEWNGESQSYTMDDGSKALLDPAYYLLESNKTEIIGDPVKGMTYFKKKCESCHGVKGTGKGDGNVYGPAINLIEFKRLSRQALHDVTISPGHDGTSYYSSLKKEQQDDLFAAFISLAGFTGYYIDKPNGSIADVDAFSNVKTAKISTKNFKGYSVLFVRSLSTDDNTDIVFTKGNELVVSIRLSNNDDINALISNEFKLTLK